MQALAQWLAATPLSRGIASVLWLIPVLQAIHILAIAAVLSAVMMVDLRILRLAGNSQTMTETAHRFVPWIWASLAVLAITGLLLIIGEPKRSLLNPAFQLKMLLLAVAIAVTVLFQSSLRRNMALWRDGAPTGKVVGALAVLTFLLWCAIAIAGRWIAYLQVY